MIFRRTNLQNGQAGNKKNVPSHQLDHIPHGRQNVPLKDVKAFLEERFDRFKVGTDFTDVKKKFGTGKRRAQRILKRGKQKRIFFTPTRRNPQQYFPESRHYDVIEYINKLNNVPKGTTGTRHFSSPLSFALEHQKASNFIEILLLAKYISREIHKIEIETSLDKKKLLEKDYYHRISTKEWPHNKGKVVEEFIDERKVTYVYYRNGKIEIWIASSEKPFPIEREDDIPCLYSFFGQLRDRLEKHVVDPRGRLVPPITTWILKQCDLNKDVPINDKAQITLPDIQLSTAFRVFRAYVKNLDSQGIDRIEESLKVNQPLGILESILNPYASFEKKLDSLEAKLDSLISINKGNTPTDSAK